MLVEGDSDELNNAVEKLVVGKAESLAEDTNASKTTGLETSTEDPSLVEDDGKDLTANIGGTTSNRGYGLARTGIFRRPEPANTCMFGKNVLIQIADILFTFNAFEDLPIRDRFVILLYMVSYIFSLDITQFTNIAFV